MLANASSREVLRLVEGLGLSGSWSWTFDTGEHAWSPGLYRLLGLTTDMKADFSLLLRFVHPEDRHLLPLPGEAADNGFSAERTLRLLRADSTLRTVDSRIETYHSPVGRPQRAMGVLVDVSAREALARVRAAQMRRDRAVFEQLGAFNSTTRAFPFVDFSDEWVELVGLPKEELLHQPALPIVKDEREHWREAGRQAYSTGNIMHILPTLVTAEGRSIRYRLLAIPAIGVDGAVESWSNHVTPLHLCVNLPSHMVEALERRLEGRHVRAARALLDWTMDDLAKASGLSRSTVKRFEDAADAPSARSIRAIASALRHHGIRFSLMEDMSISVAKSSKSNL